MIIWARTVAAWLVCAAAQCVKRKCNAGATLCSPVATLSLGLLPGKTRRVPAATCALLRPFPARNAGPEERGECADVAQHEANKPRPVERAHHPAAPQRLPSLTAVTPSDARSWRRPSCSAEERVKTTRPTSRKLTVPLSARAVHQHGDFPLYH